MELTNGLGVFLVSLAPAVELRGAIPLGMAWGVPLWKVLLIAFAGNVAVIMPLLLLLDRFLHASLNVPCIGRLLKWWFDRIEKKSDIVRKWGFWGLVLFVGVPVPGTGVWSGSLAAVMLEMDHRRAFMAMALGVLMAAVLVTFASIGVVSIWGATVGS